MGKTRLLGLADRFHLAFMPLYVLGFMGMPRRMEHYEPGLAALADHRAAGTP